jgi:tetratricopeptide (TPR) repeat protein/serine/threonine protein kinase
MARNYKEGDAPVPGYKLLKFLGRGGFGEVWKATAPGGFEVALKIINLSGKPGQKELRALQVVKRLRHPHLIQVTAFWLRDEEGNVLPDPEEALMGESTLSKAPEPTIQDTMIAPLDVMTDAVRTRPTELVIAMGLADQSLFDRLQECQRQGLPGIPTEELLGYMEDSARAIDYLNSPTHSFMGSEPMAVQHCDIKPHNILIVSGAAQVCDFGLARVMGDVQNSSAAAGTIAYAAPECIKEGKPSSTTDQYSLALSYLELKTGALPYDSETWMEVLTAVQQGNLNLTKLPQAEQVVVRRATAQNPADRFPSTTAMVHALREAALGLGPSVRQTESQPTGPTEGSESAEGLPLGILAAGLALVLALAGGGWYFWPRETTIPKKLVKGNDKKGDEDIKKKTEVPVAKTQKALGDEARGFEKFPEAIDHYTASLKEFPDDAVVHFSRGLCYLRTGRPDLAVADFEKAVELDQTDVERFRERPQFTEAYLDRGESLSEKSPAKAIEDFDRVLKANARHPAGLFGRAGALLRTKDYDGSIRDFKAAATADAKYAKSPELVAAYVARGETKLRTDPKSAEADASEALKIDDKSANAYLLRGTAKLEQGLLEESLPDFTRAIELNENDPRGRSRRGLVYLLLENYKEAIIDLSYAIKADEANPHPTDLLNRGKAYLLNGSYDHAIGDFDRLLAKDPNHAMGYYLRGDAHRNNNAPKKALEDYDKALKIDPKFAEAYFGRGIVYHGQMKYPEAVTNYTQAVKHGFYQGQAFDLRADVYEGNGQMAEAKNDRAAHALSKKIEADPKDSKSRAELAFMLATSPFADFRAGGWARELAQEACELTNEMDAASLDALAAAYAESGDFAEAVKWATKAQELATDADLKKAYAERAKKYEDKQPFRSPAPAS